MKLDKQPEIIEFYGALFNIKTGKVLEEVDELILPKNKIDEDIITAITGISNAMLVGKPRFSSVAGKIRMLLEDHRPSFITGHNISFDREMVDIEMMRIGQEPVKWKRLVCTVEQSIYIKGFRLSLSALYETLFGKAFEGAHRARVDVQAQIRCVVEMNKKGMI